MAATGFGGTPSPLIVGGVAVPDVFNSTGRGIQHGSVSPVSGQSFARYTADANGYTVSYVKSRGATNGAQGQALANDVAAEIDWGGSDGTRPYRVGRMTLSVTDNITSGTLGAAWAVSLIRTGTAVEATAIAATAARVTIGADVLRVPSKTRAEIAALTGSLVGDVVHCSNPTVSNPRLYSYSGTNWYDGAGVLLA